MGSSCHNVTNSILNHLKKGNRVTYVKVADDIVKNHIHFYLENCSKEYKKLWVCRSVDGQMKNAIPYGKMSKELYNKIEKILGEIVHGKYVCEIVSTRYNLVCDTIEHKYDIITEVNTMKMKQQFGSRITVMRYIYLEELLDKSKCDHIIATGDDDAPLF